MKTLKGPGIFIAQFADDLAPFNSWASICKWAADLGVQRDTNPYLGCPIHGP